MYNCLFSGAHITIFVLDLTIMELRDFRKDVPLSDTEYATMLKKNIISCDVRTIWFVALR